MQAINDAQGGLFSASGGRGRGCSKLPQGWIPGNLFARIAGGREAIRQLELLGSELLKTREVGVTLRRKET